MRYDERVIQEVQNRIDIVEIISARIPLKKSGRNFKANCPFHDEKTPSFMVSAEKQIFHCFGCQEGGDAFTFLMKHDSLTFPEALKELADKAGVQLPEKQMPSGEKSLSGALHELFEAATAYYEANLKDKVQGEKTREYLERRGFTTEVMAEFRLGYALPAWRGLNEYLTKKGFKEALQLKSGLVVKSAKGPLYDLLRERVIFPIFDPRGKVIAFGGRVFGDEMPKYLNSPETELFHKRNEFFGLHLAKMHLSGDLPKLFIVEGYMDQMRLYAAGFKNTVATLGTALTEEHVRKLRRYISEAILVYDGDQAGQTAADRSLEHFIRDGLSVRVLVLPQGVDPDQLIGEQGPEAFQALADKALDFFDFKLGLLLKRYSKEDPAGLMKITNDFLEFTKMIPNAVIVDQTLRRLSVALGIHEDSLRSEMGKLRGENSRLSRAAEVEKPKKRVFEKDELTLLLLFARTARLFTDIAGLVGPEDFNDAELSELFLQLKEGYEQGEPVSFTALVSRVKDAQLRARFTELSFLEWEDENSLKSARDCVREIKKRKLMKQRSDVQLCIKRAEASKNDQEVIQHLAEFKRLSDAIKLVSEQGVETCRE